MNPGAWFLHCHIAWHLSSGLALTMIEAPKLMQEWLEVPSYVKDQCDMFDKFQSTGNAAGHEGTNMKGLTTGPWPRKPVDFLVTLPDFISHKCLHRMAHLRMDTKSYWRPCRLHHHRYPGRLDRHLVFIRVRAAIPLSQQLLQV